jgi:hypothetical protein
MVMLSLAALAVELPFFVTFLLVQWLSPHCGREWLSWPILAGLFPWYVAVFEFHIIPRDLPMLQVRIGWGAFTACFIASLFFSAWQHRFWRQLLAGGLAVSSVLAILAFLLMKA